MPVAAETWEWTRVPPPGIELRPPDMSELLESGDVAKEAGRFGVIDPLELALMASDRAEQQGAVGAA